MIATMLLNLALLPLAMMITGPTAFAQETEQISPANKTRCVQQMVQWCNGMQYSQNSSGLTMISIAYRDADDFFRVLCVSDSDGTNCTRNGSPWFACKPDHALTYKGQPLTADSSDVDDDICKTVDKAFNELSIQNMFRNTTVLGSEIRRGLQSFFEEMAAMQEQMAELQRRLGFGGGFWNGFDDDFLIPGIDTVEPKDTEKSGSDDSNQVERE